MRTTLFIAVVLGAAASPAWALNQSRHSQIAYDACRRAGMPSGFCSELATQTYNVDHYEFNDLAAHSQMNEGQTACDGAQASMRRLAGIGVAIRSAIKAAAWSPSAKNSYTLAMWLGRSLHTLQDNCAHSGMPNPQHAWWSLSDTCDSTTKSPDVQPAAIWCAQTETEAIMAGVVDVLHDQGGTLSNLVEPTRTGKHFPSYGDECSFLGGAERWNGEDRRWDNTIVRPAFRAQLLEGIENDVAYTRDVCALAPDGLLISWASEIDVSVGTPSCALIHTFCLGKADSLEADEEPPYEALESVPPSSEAEGVGCSVVLARGRQHSGAQLALLLAVLAGAALIRRRPRL